jgi:YhhN family
MKWSFRCVLFSVLWLLWFVLLPGTFIAIVVTGDGSWSRFWWMSSAVLVMSAWANWFLCRRDRLGLFCALIASGMTLGMLADVYGASKVIRFTEPLAMIIPLFALGHVGYIGGMLVLARRLELTGHPKWIKTLVGTVVVYSLIGIGLWVALVRPSEDLPTMHVPTAVYTMFLAVAAAVMATVAWLDRRFWAMGIGGLLFLISDGFLAVRLFQDNWHGIGDFCWITYGIGQMLIVYGAIASGWGHKGTLHVVASKETR